MNCPKCGKKTYQGDLFCQYCGVNLENDAGNVKKQRIAVKSETAAGSAAASMPSMHIDFSEFSIPPEPSESSEQVREPSRSRSVKVLHWPPVPKTYLWQSIVLFCLGGNPFALVGMFCAISAQAKKKRGEITAASRSGERARGWCIAAVMVPVLAVVLVFGYIVVTVPIAG